MDKNESQKTTWVEDSNLGVKPRKESSNGNYSEKIILAAGCFWGVEQKLNQTPGVIETKVGYIGGKTANPTYKKVCYENTGHAEACQVTFNPNKITLLKLLEVFWAIHNPTEKNRQGADIGSQYRSAIFYLNDNQKNIVEISKKSAQKNFTDNIATEITKATTFWDAEEYHQKYIAKKYQAI